MRALREHADVTVLVPRPASTRVGAAFLRDPSALAAEGVVPYVATRALGLPARWAAHERAVARLAMPPDLVHVHLVLPDALPALIVARRRQIPVVVTEHNSFLAGLLTNRRARLQARLVLRSADAVVAVGEALAESLHRVEESVRPFVIGNAVDTELFRPDGAPRDLVAMAVAPRLSLEKGIDLLTAAWPAVHRRTGLRLKLVGEPTADLDRWLAEHSARQLVDVVSGLSREELAAAMRRATVVVSASRSESFGVALAEAIASGTPVVATRSGGPEDFVTPAVGRLVDRGDVQALTDAVVDVASDGEQRYPPDVLHAHIASRYGFAAIAGELLALYGRVLATRRRSRRP